MSLSHWIKIPCHILPFLPSFLPILKRSFLHGKKKERKQEILHTDGERERALAGTLRSGQRIWASSRPGQDT